MVERFDLERSGIKAGPKRGREGASNKRVGGKTGEGTGAVGENVLRSEGKLFDQQIVFRNKNFTGGAEVVIGGIFNLTLEFYFCKKDIFKTGRNREFSDFEFFFGTVGGGGGDKDVGANFAYGLRSIGNIILLRDKKSIITVAKGSIGIGVNF
jgi:hypothetical protein